MGLKRLYEATLKAMETGHFETNWRRFWSLGAQKTVPAWPRICASLTLNHPQIIRRGIHEDLPDQRFGRRFAPAKQPRLPGPSDDLLSILVHEH